jgi:hypothetical protein
MDHDMGAIVVLSEGGKKYRKWGMEMYMSGNKI